MNILLVPIGSHGDVHPFVGIGLALRARGHRVRVIVNPFFGPLVEQAGLELVALRVGEDYTRMAGNAEIWSPFKGPRIIFSSIGAFFRPVYDAVVANNIAGDTVVVSSTLAMGARVAQDRHDIPNVTVHLQPSVLRSYKDPATLPVMMTGPRVPRWVVRLQYAIVDHLVIDPLVRPALNGLRREVGLGPVRGILREYIHSPQRVIGMFPGWFAPPQTDWPAQARLTGFPLYDERGVTALSPELREFLAAGDKPIAFTFGSAMWHARELLEQSARACTLLGRRGMLLTRHRDHLPPRLPVGVKHFDFAPFSELLPHCCALVHHGGIGTASQALAAGIPHLVLPHAHDQLDNATRLARLGVAKIIHPKQYISDHVAQALGDLLGSETVVQSCRAVAEKFVATDPMRETCELIEELGAKRGVSTAMG